MCQALCQGKQEAGWEAPLGCYTGRSHTQNKFPDSNVTIPTKIHIIKAMVFSVVIYGWESWARKKTEHQRIDAFKLWCWSHLDIKKIKPVIPKGNQPWIFIGRTDAEAEAPILWPPDVKSRLTGKDSDIGKYWGQEEKRMTKDEMVGWHHWLNGHEYEQTPGDGEGQGRLACCIAWGCKELDMTEQLNNNKAAFVFEESFFQLIVFLILPKNSFSYIPITGGQIF